MVKAVFVNPPLPVASLLGPRVLALLAVPEVLVDGTSEPTVPEIPPSLMPPVDDPDPLFVIIARLVPAVAVAAVLYV